MILTGREDCTRAVIPVADGLLQEMTTFGRLASASTLEEDQFATFTAAAGFTMALLEALQGPAELRFRASVKAPYCYNTGSWPPSLGPAGHLGEPGQVLPPAEAARSLFLNWNLAVTDSGLLSSRLLRCASWQMARHGVPAAVDLVVDLFEWGYCNAGSVFDVYDVIMRAGAVSQDPDFVVGAFFGGAVPTTPAEFLQADLHLDWLDDVVAGDSLLGRSALEALIARASRSVVTTREAGSVGEWFTAQVQLGALLTLFLPLQRTYVPTPGPGLQVLLGQWEEIQADAVGFELTCRAGFAFPTWETVRAMSDSVGAAYRSRLPSDWEARMSAERLVVPSQVRDQVLHPEIATDVPPRWVSLDASEILPWTLLFRGGEAAALFTRTGEMTASPPDVVLAELKALIEGAGDDLAAQVSRASQLCARYPYLSAAHQELGIAHHLAGDVEAGIDELAVALALEPAEPMLWRSLAVALNQGGYRNEAAMAHAVEEWISSRSV